MTKVWGFKEPYGPLRFSKNGWRNNALKVLKKGDLVALVCTSGKNAKKNEKGRLLGIVEPSRESVCALEFNVRIIPSCFGKNGKYKWPYALVNKQAWILDDPPLFKDITNRKFPRNAALGIFELNSQEEKQILNLSKRRIKLLSRNSNAQNVYNKSVYNKKTKKRGAPPPPTSMFRRKGVMHRRHAPAYTYCMEIVGAKKSSFKIGWAFDYKLREKHFNKSALPDIGGIKYRTKCFNLWGTAKKAYKMEQNLLKKFENYRTTLNQEVLFEVPYETIEKAWEKYKKISNVKQKF